jgi:hypothetical protein
MVAAANGRKPSRHCVMRRTGKRARLSGGMTSRPIVIAL